MAATAEAGMKTVLILMQFTHLGKPESDPDFKNRFNPSLSITQCSVS